MTHLIANVGMTTLDSVVLGVYLMAMMAMGVIIARRQQSTDDFFVGGRNMPSWAIGISILASLLSTITYLGMPGEMFRTGYGFLTRQLGVPIVLAVVCFLWLPFFMKLNLTSAYEYLERRFDYKTRVIAAIFCLLLLFGWMSVVVLTASKAMAEIAALDLNWFFGTNTAEFRDADLHAIIIGIGLFSVMYTTLGGLRAVVWTDVIQFFILIGGALFTIGYVVWRTQSSPADWIEAQQAYAHRESVEWFSWDISNRSTVCFISLGMCFWFICTHGANQVALQRYFAVKDVWEARKSYLISAVSSFALSCILATVGLALLYFITQFDLPANENINSDVVRLRYEAQDKVFPQFISIFLPSGLRGMVVAALFAAAMSTIDSGANSVSTIVTVDFIRPRSGGKINVDRELKTARVLTASMGVIIVIATLALYHLSKGTDIISLCQKGFNCFLGPLGALFVLGMFSRKATPKTVVPAIFIGELVGVLTSYSGDICKWLSSALESDSLNLLIGTVDLNTFSVSTHLVVPLSWLATIVVSILLSIIFRTEATAEEQTWLWKNVLSRPRETEAESTSP